MVYRECTRHDWCSKVGEVKSALPDLNGLPLALVLIISARSLPLRLSRLGAHLGKVIRTPASETAVIIIGASGWLSIRPRAVLLLLRCKSSLLRKPESSLLLLLRRLNNPTPWLRGPSERVRVGYSAQCDTSVQRHSRVQQVPCASFQRGVQK